MSKKKRIFALDLGTTKFCLASLELNSKAQPYQFDALCVNSQGMHRGMLSEFSQAREALNQCLKAAEKQFNTDIGQVCVGVSGGHLKSFATIPSVSLGGRVIQEEDLLALKGYAMDAARHDGREILHLVPLNYQIDNRPLTADPLGLRGSMLRGTFVAIDADKDYLRDLVALCNGVGLKITSLYAEPYASAEVTVPDSAKQLGAAVCDIGGGTTDGIVFQSGKPVKLFTVNVGGMLFTNDISIGMNLPFIESERIKCQVGLDWETVELAHNNLGQQVALDPKKMRRILLARSYELGSLITRELSEFKGKIGGGIYFTGGGSETKGLMDLYQQKIGVPVYKLRPCRPDSTTSSPPKLATALGLVNLEYKRRGEILKRNTNWTSRIATPLFKWIKEMS